MRGLFLVLCAGVLACIGERGPFTNRMANSGTTYLARAARQPVRWQPWGRDAFALAAKLDRPILLYIGSATCHWCAETDRAIYTDPEIGALINTLFVPVRVDRDERPDVAQRYQAAVERLAGLRGWPLTVFLTTDGSAFFGGTYFPADDPTTGRGLKQLLPEVAKSYREQRSFVVQQAARVRELVLAGTRELRGTLRPSLVQQGIFDVIRDLTEAVRSRTAAGNVTHAQAASLLLRDTTARASALRALDFMLDTTAGIAGEDPPRLVRAALAGSLARAWIVTGDRRYWEAGRALVERVVDDLPSTEAVFTDQQAYIIEKVLRAAATLGESTAVRRSRVALDVVLQRTYARGWGVRHSVAETPGGGGAQPGLLQDQVEMALACVTAHQMSGEVRYLNVALDLAAVTERDYADPAGGYFDTADATPSSLPGLADRTKHVLDDVLPGANAETALLLARLAQVTGDPAYRHRAQRTLEAFAAAIPGAGVRAGTYLAAARETLEIP
ncbi:MAG: hypothetical protein AUH41_09475 [Gemmatimonadetes bacterium 13_1_40CM_66_11]|nr:MAG: hypothetical protein AUH41_09475 [Gemmatimonadetes bacterium 13_1_40CM_66_11]